jgi:HPt (histidine-containing phosphotransfer) domain-containing protein
MEEKKYCNLDYLKSHSPNNPKFVVEIIKMFLEQTPVFITAVNKCLSVEDWDGLYGNVHKIRPSIDLIGMEEGVSTKAKQIENYCKERKNLDLIPAMVIQLEKELKQAYKELEDELISYPS